MVASRFHQFFYAFGALVALARIAFIAIGINILSDPWLKITRKYESTSFYDEFGSRLMGLSVSKLIVTIFTVLYYVSQNANSVFTSIGMDFILNTVLFILAIIVNVVFWWWAIGGWWLAVDRILFIVQDLMFLIILIFETIYVVCKRRVATRSLMRTGFDELARSGHREAAMTTKDIPVHHETVA